MALSSGPPPHCHLGPVERPSRQRAHQHQRHHHHHHHHRDRRLSPSRDTALPYLDHQCRLSAAPPTTTTISRSSQPAAAAVTSSRLPPPPLPPPPHRCQCRTAAAHPRCLPGDRSAQHSLQPFDSSSSSTICHSPLLLEVAVIVVVVAVVVVHGQYHLLVARRGSRCRRLSTAERQQCRGRHAHCRHLLHHSAAPAAMAVSAISSIGTTPRTASTPHHSPNPTCRPMLASPA